MNKTLQSSDKLDPETVMKNAEEWHKNYRSENQNIIVKKTFRRRYYNT